MPAIWVKAGECGNESLIAMGKTSLSKASVSAETTCPYIQAFVDELPQELDIGQELSKPITETTVYRAAENHVCRNSCVTPAAILKALEVLAGVYLPAPVQIEFVDGVI
ncbi:MAG: DUF6951 family protein [Chloroflexota bacterium]